jgi:hypothetical protein
MQLYIEKWLQIIYRITGILPPVPGPQLILMLDQLFLELQTPFDNFKHAGRKNFLNYNYVFCRLFQKLECNQFCMFFPLIKSRQKLKALDDMWLKMTQALNWEVKPLVPVPPFAVKLDGLDLLRPRIATQIALSAPVAQHTVPSKREFQTLDRPLEESNWQPLKLRRSDQLVLQFQRSAGPKRRFDYTWAANLRCSHQ